MTVDVANPVDRFLQALADAGCEPKQAGRNQWEARCPAHDDRRPSLSIGRGDDGTALVKCQAGCATDDVVKAVGLNLRDLFAPTPTARRRKGGGKGEIVGAYDYRDEAGKLLFQTVRFEPKDFRQRRPDGNGGWVWDLKGVRRILYRLSDLADADRPVYIVEGEKDADRLAGLGLLATCNPMGAGKWSKCDDTPLHGRHVRIIGDNDQVGRLHGQGVARRLYGKAASVRIVELPDLPEHGDASDWLDDGGTVEALAELADNAPEYKPTDDEPIEVPDDRPEARTYMRTDLGNGERFADQHRGTVRFCHPWAKWLIWTGQRWAVDDAGRVKALAKRTVRSIYREAAATEDDVKRQALVQHARASESNTRIQALLALAQSEPGIPVRPDDLDRDPWGFNVTNGTLDLRTGRLRPHDPADLITKLAGAEYLPEALAPIWTDKFLPEVFAGRDDVIRYVQRAVGYSITGVIRQHVLQILWGRGRNGKGTFIETFGHVLGDYAATLAPKLLMLRRYGDAHPTELASLHGIRFVSTNETDEGGRFDESRVKWLTGGDRISARRVYQDFWEFRPTHKVWLATNHRPEVRGVDEAIWRRLRLIPFTVQFVGRSDLDADGHGPYADETMPERLRAEASGILAWAVRGCLEWQRDGLGVVDDVRAATLEYRESQDGIGRFIVDRCLTGSGYQVAAKDLYRAYSTWCDDGGERPVNQRQLGEYLAGRDDLGLKRSRTRAARTWLGIGLAHDGGDEG